MITLASIPYDLNGYLSIANASNSDVRQLTRRATRTATLDGQSTSVSFGVSDSDRNFKIEAHDLSTDQLDILIHIFRNYEKVKISTDDDVTICILSDIDYNKNPVQIDALVLERINA